MIQTEMMKQLLNAEDTDLKKLKLDQLRIMLGVFRYFVRTLEREINERSTDSLSKRY